MLNLSSIKIREAIDQELKIRQQAADQQKRLIDSQISYFDAKSDALKQGLGEITITADGLEPELEAFMWQILERVQLRATSDQANFLLGLT